MGPRKLPTTLVLIFTTVSLLLALLYFRFPTQKVPLQERRRPKAGGYVHLANQSTLSARPTASLQQIGRPQAGQRVLSSNQSNPGIRPNLPLQQLRRQEADNCFSPEIVDLNSSCANCVHFITCAVASERWGSDERLPQGLHVMTAAVRASQTCFTLHVYANAPKGSKAWKSLEKAGGDNVTVQKYPTNLPKNAYSSVNKWFELSRRKLDLLERYEKQHSRKAIWIDLDTIIVANLSCAYARVPNFVVSRHRIGRRLLGPGRKEVLIHPNRSVFGDLFMLDKALTEKVRDLEASGMPPPRYDLQDYFSFMLNRCDGSVIDLRALIREDGFAQGGGMCFAFDFSGGQHPKPNNTNLQIIDNRLHCGVNSSGTIEYIPVAVLSFTADSYWSMLRAPQGYFHTATLMKWAKTVGIGSDD